MFFHDISSRRNTSYLLKLLLLVYPGRPWSRCKCVDPGPLAHLMHPHLPSVNLGAASTLRGSPTCSHLQQPTSIALSFLSKMRSELFQTLILAQQAILQATLLVNVTGLNTQKQQTDSRTTTKVGSQFETNLTIPLILPTKTLFSVRPINLSASASANSSTGQPLGTDEPLAHVAMMCWIDAYREPAGKWKSWTAVSLAWNWVSTVPAMTVVTLTP